MNDSIQETALMVKTDEIARLIGGTAYDSAGTKVGTIGMVYLDDQTDEPDWVTVNTGFFGSNESFVPLAGAVTDGDSLRLAYTADQIKDAPTVDADAHLDVEQEDELYQHYGRLPSPGRPHPDPRTDSTESENLTMAEHSDQHPDQQDSHVDTDVVAGTAAGEEMAEGILDVEKASTADHQQSSAEGGSDVNLRAAEDTADHRRD